MQPIASTSTTSHVKQVASELWAYWSQTVEPLRPPVPSIFKSPPTIAATWRVSPEAGRAYAMTATQRFCDMHGIAALPETAWTWVPSTRAHARCARLKYGGLRVATPEPSTIIGLMLLCHELCHAALEWQVPGSLADTESTETFAMAGELFAQQWLLSFECPERSSFSLAQAIASWTQEREYEFGTRHAALARFEWLLWSAAQADLKPKRLESFTESAWQLAHTQLGLTAKPDAWATHPLITRKPGSAGVYPAAWRAVQKEVLCET